jgi:ParB family chromosome partitioning protein
MADSRRTWDVARLLGLARAGSPEKGAPDDKAGSAGDGALPPGARYLAEVSVESVRPNPFQPREYFDEEDLTELAESISEVGIIQPLVVREAEPGLFELVAGERRLRASRLAGLATVPVVVIEAGPGEQELLALVENLQRRDLTAIEEAHSFQAIMERTGWSQTELARRIGRSQSAVANKLRLLSLHPAVQELVRQGKLGERHARSLLKVGFDEQEALAGRALAEGLTARELEKMVRPSQGKKKKRPAGKKTPQFSDMEAELLQDMMDLTALFREKGLPVVLKVREQAGKDVVFEVRIRRP